MTSPFDPQTVLAVLVRHGVDFVVIGGFAAVAQGSPFPTADVDVTPASTDDNLTRLSAALTDLDARVRAEGVDGGLPFRHDAASLASSGVWNLTTRAGDLDISFVPTGTQGYPDLVRDALTVTVGGVEIRLASLRDVVRSKEAAGRDKDRRVLPLLRELVERQRRAAQGG